jgi:1-acyl-sn-glycerol-3-phosphate acyltransferase
MSSGSEAASQPPQARFDKFKRWLRVLLWIQIGKIRFEGLHHLQFDGPKIITPNHGSSADMAILLAFAKPIRSLATSALFDFAGGRGGKIFGPIGAIPVDLTPGKGAAALNVAVQHVINGETLLLFPEGWAWMDGGVRPFKKGAVVIARQASTQLGEPVPIVPVGMHYGRYPGKWILKYPPPVQYLLAFLLSPVYRRGLVIRFGSPIPSDTLPLDAHIASVKLREAVLALKG